MGRLLVLLLGVAIGGLLIFLFLGGSSNEPSRSTHNPDATLKVQGATATEDSIKLQRSADLIRSTQEVSLSTVITDPNAAVQRALHAPDTALTASAQGLPPKLYIKDANSSLPSIIAELPAPLFIQERSGPQIAQPDSSFLTVFRGPGPSLQSASAQVQVQPVISDADSTRLRRAQRPNRLLESNGENSSVEAP